VEIYGIWIYAILFAIIFCETGLVFAPFLPGDSLLLLLGFLAAAGGLSVGIIILILPVAIRWTEKGASTLGRQEQSMFKSLTAQSTKR
jgi:hypothetical protein